MRTNKQLRDFVRSREMRFLAFIDEYSYGSTIGIKKAYKVDVEGHALWVRFGYGTRPYIVGEYDVKHNLFKTREEAEERAEAMRKVREVKRKEEVEERKKILDKAAEILHDRYYDITDKKGKLKDEYKMIYDAAEDMVRRYGSEPDTSEVLRRYIKTLETYIMTGMIVIDDNTSISKAAISKIRKNSVTLIDNTTIKLDDVCVTTLLQRIAGLNIRIDF